ncbi:MAG: guanylate kinase [Proteobacteria bacterium]|nr:guanylate kinase [Pseudomonadota bacterium]
MSEGHFFVISAPSGTGKTSLVQALVNNINDLQISISYTTRSPRPGDVHGKDYYFVTPQQFTQMSENSEFLEEATIYQHHYATSREWVMSKLIAGIDVLLEIDWQGAQQIRRLFPSAILIFILPPSLETLWQRLQNRRQDHEDVITMRMSGAKQEISHFPEFDYLVINDKFEQALADLQHIVMAERLRCKQQTSRHAELLAKLLE